MTMRSQAYCSSTGSIISTIFGIVNELARQNPCGEIPLPSYGACDLGSVNLTRFVVSPFTSEARIDLQSIERTTVIAVRFLDNVIDVSRFPLAAQAESARGSRRIGLGITGLADAMVMLGVTYGTAESLALACNIMCSICHAAYRASIALAEEKKSFSYFEQDRYLKGAFIEHLPVDIRAGIASAGIRNSHLLAIAPTGTISLLAGNVSSGLEPIFAGSYTRNVLSEDGTAKPFMLTDYALDLWRRTTGVSLGCPKASSPLVTFLSALIWRCRPRSSHSLIAPSPRPSTSPATPHLRSSTRSTTLPMTGG